MCQGSMQNALTHADAAKAALPPGSATRRCATTAASATSSSRCPTSPSATTANLASCSGPGGRARAAPVAPCCLLMVRTTGCCPLEVLQSYTCAVLSPARVCQKAAVSTLAGRGRARAAPCTLLPVRCVRSHSSHFCLHARESMYQDCNQVSRAGSVSPDFVCGPDTPFATCMIHGT